MNKTLIAGLFLTAITTQTVHAEDKVNFSKYMQRSTAISAIASAVDATGGCSVPIEFDETKEEGFLILGVHCRGTEDDEMSIFIRFMVDDYSILPLKFDYAG